MTRRIFSSSRIRLTCVCRRPAVSISTTSTPRERAAATPSYTTAAGSPPSACLTISQSTRFAHSVSCSTAAARKVSPATMSGVFPISLSRQAILPMVVVLPVPLTPTTRITVGCAVTSILCDSGSSGPVSYTHLRAHETRHDLVCRLLLEKKKRHYRRHLIVCHDFIVISVRFYRLLVV